MKGEKEDLKKPLDCVPGLPPALNGKPNRQEATVVLQELPVNHWIFVTSDFLLHIVVVGAPASRFIKQVRQQGGYASCFRCTNIGSLSNRCVIFLSNVDRTRTRMWTGRILIFWRSGDEYDHSDSHRLHPRGLFELAKRLIFISWSSSSNKVVPIESNHTRMLNDRFGGD